MRAEKQEALLNALTSDYTRADIPAADRAMLDYAVKLTRTPGSMEAQDVINLRKAGFSDAAILDINQVTAYYAYVNRLADGLGVGMEAFWETG